MGEGLSVYTGKKLGGDKCWYCGDELYRSTRTKDHFWPKCLGGRLLVVCCRNCNKMKKDYTPMGFVELIKHTKKKHPDYQPYQKRFDRMIVATTSLWDRVKHSI